MSGGDDLNTPFLDGPRHWGQSPPEAIGASEAIANTQTSEPDRMGFPPRN
jgi:hypothetical protein